MSHTNTPGGRSGTEETHITADTPAPNDNPSLIPTLRNIDGVLTIDVEEWFCAHNLSPPLQRSEWQQYERRAEQSTLRLLDLFEEANTTATFFLLGWVMEHVPDLGQEIQRRGHEVASHGYAHVKITEQSREEFTRDIDTALELHARQRLHAPIGYRAPSFTLTARTMWIVPILESRGLQYSSSVFPMRGHPVYGIPDAPLTPWRIGEHLIEVPLSVADYGKLRLPCGGGAYLRLFPWYMTRTLLHRVRAQDRLLNLYLHPWETDPDQPRLDIPLQKRVRHYTNLHRTSDRLRRLLSEFRLTSIKEMLCLR